MDEKLLSIKERGRNYFILSKDKIYESLYKTGNSDLDEYLQGGLPLGKFIHIYGPAGVGKSQFCMQLAANMWKQEKVRLCCFLCCNNVSFTPSRYLQICSEFNVQKDKNELLSNVFVAELSSINDVVNALNELSSSEMDIGFVSVEGLFDFTEYGIAGTHYAFTEALGQAMLSISEIKKCLTIFVNQVRASFQTNQTSDVTPALGPNFYMHALFRIFMNFQSEERSVRKIELQRWSFSQKDPFLFTLSKRGIEAFLRR
uniref:DNA recombination and repair protein Rad51-like C-terminal domain-containing protein n=1 Tax=Panagrolaimus superbus TaxID=310955 RepID=A0A914XQV2_9BILA